MLQRSAGPRRERQGAERRPPPPGHAVGRSASGGRRCAQAARLPGQAPARRRWRTGGRAGWSRPRSQGSSNIKRRCSFVMPDGPAAEPRRAVRKLASSSVSGRGHGSAGTWLSTSGLSGTTGVWGRRRGSRSSASVAAFPSAERLGRESSARCGELAEADERAGAGSAAGDVGPSCGRARGRPRGCGGAGGSKEGEPVAASEGLGARSSSTDSMRVWPGSRCRSMRGARKNSFHPRASSSGPAPATACSSPVRSANRRVP